MFTTLLHLEGEEIIQSAFERKNLTNLEKYKGLLALLGKGSINGEPYLKVQKWTFERLELKPFQEMASNLKKPKSVSQNEFKALQLAFSNLGNSYFMGTAEKTRY